MHVKGQIIGIFISPQSTKLTGVFSPMVSVDEVVAVASKGLKTDDIEDRYSAREGFYDKKGPKKKRDVTLVAEEALEGTGYAGEETRRNIVVRGIDPIHLSLLKDITFKVGEATFRGYDVCTPCDIPQESMEKGGIERGDFTEAFPGRMGGLRAEIIEGATLRVGDTIEADISDEIIAQYKQRLK